MRKYISTKHYQLSINIFFKFLFHLHPSSSVDLSFVNLLQLIFSTFGTVAREKGTREQPRPRGKTNTNEKQPRGIPQQEGRYILELSDRLYRWTAPLLSGGFERECLSPIREYRIIKFSHASRARCPQLGVPVPHIHHTSHTMIISQH